MRMFFGMPLDEDGKKAVAEYSRRLRERIPGVKISWVKPENLHVTMRFLGERPADFIPTIRNWPETFQGVRKISVGIGPVGAFPGVLYLRVLPVEPFQEIYRKLDEVLAAAGIEKEPRSYVPHLTIGRVRSRQVDSDDLVQLARQSEFSLKSVMTSIILYKSVLTPQGPIYTHLSDVKLSS